MRPLILMVHSFRRYTLVAFLSAFVLPGIASARNIIVAPSGGDFSTVAAGVGAARPGDTVTVRAGTYNEAVSFGLSGSAAAGFITLQGDPGAILVIEFYGERAEEMGSRLAALEDDLHRHGIGYHHQQATAVDAKTGVSQVVTQGVAVPFPPGFTPSAVGC